MSVQGGYRISNELKKDLVEINRLAEINLSIADVSDGIGVRDQKELMSNSKKIKNLAIKWIGR